MKFRSATADESKNITKQTNARSQESSKERAEIVSTLTDLEPGAYLLLDPDTRTIKGKNGASREEPETLRGIRMRISKAAKEVGITDLQFGVHNSGALAVWRDASAKKNARKRSLNGAAEASKEAVTA